MMKAVRAELIAHVGGLPTAMQAALIEQIVQLRLRLATSDRKFAETGEMAGPETQSYVALTDSVGRLLRQLDERDPRLPDSPAGAARPNNPATPTCEPPSGFDTPPHTSTSDHAAPPLSGPEPRETPLARQLVQALTERRAANERTVARSERSPSHSADCGD